MQSWWVDEVSRAGAEHLDAAYVGRYDAKAGFDPRDDVEALRAHGLCDRSTLIDFGAGTGEFAFSAAKTGARVVAVDVSPEMVAAMRTARDSQSARNVEIVKEGFLSFGGDRPPADFAYSRNALHHVPDFWKGIALQRIRDSLKTGGVFLLRDLVFDFAPAEAPARIEEWLGSAVDDPQRGFTADELAEHVKQEFSTYSWLLEPMLERTGFQILDRDYRKRIYARYACRAV